MTGRPFTLSASSTWPLTCNLCRSVRLLNNRYGGRFEATQFALALARKDIALATELGREHDVPMPVANLVEQIAIEAISRGWGDMDSSVNFLLQEEKAGVEVRAEGVDPEWASRFISTNPDPE